MTIVKQKNPYSLTIAAARTPRNNLHDFLNASRPPSALRNLRSRLEWLIGKTSARTLAPLGRTYESIHTRALYARADKRCEEIVEVHEYFRLLLRYVNSST